MTRIILLSNAVVKSISHGAKYPQGRVNGLFIGKCSHSETDKEDCIIYDAVPVAHTHCITHINNIAVLLAREYCKESGLSIVGYYQADSTLDIKNAEITEEKVPFPKEILGLADDLFLCKLNYSHLSKDILNCFEFEGDIKLFITETAINSLENILETSGYSKLVDIDDHLDEHTSDFLNTKFVDKDKEESVEIAKKLNIKV